MHQIFRREQGWLQPVPGSNCKRKECEYGCGTDYKDERLQVTWVISAKAVGQYVGGRCELRLLKLEARAP